MVAELADGGAGFEHPDVLDAVAACRRHVNTAQADVWEYVASFCDAAAAVEAAHPTSGIVHTWPYGGDGTPDVPEGAVVEVAAELGESREAATRLVANAMNLTHRLNRVHTAVTGGDIDWRKADLVATGTLALTAEQTDRVQDLLLPDGSDPTTSLLARITRRRLSEVIDQVLATTDPDTLDDDIDAALDARDVSIYRSEAGICQIEGTLSTEDGARVASSLRRVAGWLRETGDTRPAGVRRSSAVAILADPARHQHLWDHVRAVRAAARAASTTAIDDLGADPDTDPDAPAATPPAGIPGTHLFVHHDRTTDTWTLDGTTASDPCAGILTRAEAARLVGHDHVRVTPVLDLAAELTYTSYQAPPRLKAQLAQRNHGRCAFPWCDRHASVPAGSASVDYDHTRPWPNGRTTSTNGAMLCEPHHRAKTFLGWHVRQPSPGTWLWTSPRRHRWLVTAGTTTPLD